MVNSSLTDTFDMEATVEVFSPTLENTFKRSVPITRIPANSSTLVLPIPETAFHSDQQFSFVRLTLAKGGGVTTSTNFYWVPTTLTEFNWAKTDYTHTPALKAVQLSELRKLPPATVQVETALQGDEIVVRMKNTSQALAFQVNAQVLDSTNNNVPTVAWNDNFIELMPQESQTVSAPLPKSVKPDSLTVQISGWNLTTLKRPLKR